MTSTFKNLSKLSYWFFLFSLLLNHYLFATSPPCIAKESAAFTANPLTGYQYCFGGVENGKLKNDLWIHDGEEWKEYSTLSAPSPRKEASLAYDFNRGYLFLFGGSAQDQLLNDLWFWDGNKWEECVALQAPHSREGGALAFDHQTDCLVLFGGKDEECCSQDTWVWNGEIWIEQNGLSPLPRHGASFRFDSLLNQLILKAGKNQESSYDDQWIWSGGQWMELASHQAIDLLENKKRNLSQKRENQNGQKGSNSVCLDPNHLVQQVGDVILGVAAYVPVFTHVGQTIQYLYVVTNNTIVLQNLTVDSSLSGTIFNNIVFQGGQTRTATVNYVVTAADMSAKQVTNLVRTTSIIGEVSTSLSLNLAQLSVSITASPTSVNHAGDIITYTYAITNSGAVNLSALTVSDDKLGPILNGGTLNANQTITETRNYTVTQADMDAGSITNHVTAQGSTSTNPVVNVSAIASSVVGVNSAPAIVITQTASPSFVSSAGDVITYNLMVENTGNVTLSHIIILGPDGNVEFTVPNLAPGQSYTVLPAPTYIVTQADIEAGEIVKTREVSGDSPSGVVAQDLSDSVVPVETTSSISILKMANPPVMSAEGQVITYTLTVTNTGSTVLTDIHITDSLTGTATGTSQLQPGESYTVSPAPTYTVTQADIDAGQIVNTATVNAMSPVGSSVSDAATFTVVLEHPSSLLLTKNGVLNFVSGVGRVITYSYVVTNTGNVAINHLELNDDKLGSYAIPDLEPLASYALILNYTVTQSDLDNGSIINLAQVDGTTALFTPVISNQASFTVFVNQIILPPRHLQGYRTSNQFLDQVDYIDVLKWKAPSGGELPVGYKIFSDAQLKNLVAKILYPNVTEYRVHNRRKQQSYTYYLVSVDSLGMMSKPISITISARN